MVLETEVLSFKRNYNLLIVSADKVKIQTILDRLGVIFNDVRRGNLPRMIKR